MTQTQILNFTAAFPPAEKLTETLMNIDYKKHFHSFMDAVVIFCAFVAAMATLIAQKWQEYDCTERLQLFVLNVIQKAKTFYAWVMNVFVPFVKSFYDDCRSVYNVLRTI
jgi:hypothetical protein